jgi:hypothetical protein
MKPSTNCIDRWADPHDTDVHELAIREDAHEDTSHYIAIRALAVPPEPLHSARHVIATS